MIPRKKPWLVARKSSPSFRIGHDQISQRAALAGSAPTMAPVGAFFYEPRVTRGNVVSLRCRGVTASVEAAARYALRAPRSVVVSLSLPRRNAAFDSEEKAVARGS